MARKRAGDFLNILSDPEKSTGLLAGSTPIMLKAGQPAPKGNAFPGVIGLGAVSGTGVAPKQRKAILGDDDGESGGGKFRMDLALAALLGLLVTNIVSFTLGARAGRQAHGPETTTALAPAEVTSATPLFSPDPQTAVTTPAPVTPPQAAPQRGQPNVAETGPIGMSATARMPSSPAAPTTTSAAPRTPAPQPPAAPVSLEGKYVVRLITLRYDAHRQALAQKIKAYMESQGFSCIVRTSNGKLVVEAGAFDQFRSADQAKAKIRKMKCGHERFDSAYVVQRTKK